jgi:Uma2 family endonuclease
MSAEELLDMPDDGMQHELVRGELTTMAPAGAHHGRVSSRIHRRLGDYVESHSLGETFSSDTGFILCRNPDTVRQPDASFVRQERDLDERGFYPGAPDLAVEVISPSDRFTDVQAKVLDYLHAGTRMVIILDPVTQFANVYTSNTMIHVGIDDAIDGADVVPGWKLPLRELFE